ncbi:alpha/beta fold hydrolase [Sinomonas sp. ASV322]|uniref:alpha/beta fold hydrolase n=1 Tax=Sinomonas sp. ASV322 TaxID=3041920 RepID=UPI0027DE577C|nr:alpha/beta fold hydrolase [Sinomonas sp. ASV322]MDQ4504365.1 alpha/beta fold hydrolase [Sinomonas sp. ASV322]
MKFVLVHGAWHYGELWDPVRAHLEAAGHEVHTPTAGGLGPDDDKHVDLRGAANPIIEYIRAHDLDDIVLVGHSWGGYLISRVAIELPHRIRRLVYFAAFVPEHGKALVDEVPPHLRAALQASADERGDGSVVLPFPVWRDGFFNDGSAEHARDVHRVLRPQPYGAFTDPADMTGWENVPQAFTYLNPYDDNDITQGEWGRHPRLSNRLGVFRLVGMEGSHEVLLTRPAYTAEKLIEAGRD